MQHKVYLPMTSLMADLLIVSSFYCFNICYVSAVRFIYELRQKCSFFLIGHIATIASIVFASYCFYPTMDVFRYNRTDVCRMKPCHFTDLLGICSFGTHDQYFKFCFRAFVSIRFPSQFDLFFLC